MAKWRIGPREEASRLAARRITTREVKLRARTKLELQTRGERHARPAQLSPSTPQPDSNTMAVESPVGAIPPQYLMLPLWTL